MITFGSKFNRRYSIYFPLFDDNIVLEIFFNRNNPNVAFSLDKNTYNQIKDDDNICYNLYGDITNSSFSNFLVIENIKTTYLDIVNQFSDVKNEYKDRIQYLTNESIKVCRVNTKNGEFDSMLYMYGFTCADFLNEYLFLIAERQHIDNKLNKKIVRSYGLQLCYRDRRDEIVELSKLQNQQESEKLDDVL